MLIARGRRSRLKLSASSDQPAEHGTHCHVGRDEREPLQQADGRVRQSHGALDGIDEEVQHLPVDEGDRVGDGEQARGEPGVRAVTCLAHAAVSLPVCSRRLSRAAHREPAGRHSPALRLVVIFPI
jgi:hypothetical protein